jgi:hypothetical protein
MHSGEIMPTSKPSFRSKSFKSALFWGGMGLLSLQACAPLYYPAPMGMQGQYQNQYQYQSQTPYQPQVVVVKNCDCPPQGIGFVRINSAPPFASVYVNGKPEGETPLEYLSIPAGQAHIELIHRQFGPTDTTIQIHPGEKIDLKMHLSQGDAFLP